MALIKQYIEGGICTLTELAGKVADKLVLTGKWDKIVDNTPVAGTNPAMTQFVIVAPKQTYRYATATASATDMGASAGPRYIHQTGYGEERLFVKMTPFFDASGLIQGLSWSKSNGLNTGGTDFYGTSGEITSGTSTYNKLVDGTITNTTPFGTTNTYYAKYLNTAQITSPTNTNYTYHNILTAYNTMVSKDSQVRFRLVVGTDDSPTIENTKDKQDWFVLVVQGLTGVTAYTNYCMCGIGQTTHSMYNNWGVSRSFFFSEDYQFLSFASILGMNDITLKINPTGVGNSNTVQFDIYPINTNRLINFSLVGINHSNGSIATNGFSPGYGGSIFFSNFGSLRLNISDSSIGFIQNIGSTYNNNYLFVRYSVQPYNTTNNNNYNYRNLNEPWKKENKWGSIFYNLLLNNISNFWQNLGTGVNNNGIGGILSEIPYKLPDPGLYIMPVDNVSAGMSYASVQSGDYITLNGIKHLLIRNCRLTTSTDFARSGLLEFNI